MNQTNKLHCSPSWDMFNRGDAEHSVQISTQAPDLKRLAAYMLKKAIEYNTAEKQYSLQGRDIYCSNKSQAYSDLMVLYCILVFDFADLSSHQKVLLLQFLHSEGTTQADDLSPMDIFDRNKDVAFSRRTASEIYLSTQESTWDDSFIGKDIARKALGIHYRSSDLKPLDLSLEFEKAWPFSRESA